MGKKNPISKDFAEVEPTSCEVIEHFFHYARSLYLEFSRGVLQERMIVHICLSPLTLAITSQQRSCASLKLR